jgi:hypothetical protein
LENRGRNRIGAVGTVGREEVVGKGVGGWIWCKQCIHMYVNTKMIPVEAVPGIRGGEMWESSGRVNSCKIYLLHCKNLCKCYNVPHPAQ